MLGYTTFAHSNLRVADVERLEVSFKVTNSRTVRGEIVAQLHVSARGVERAGVGELPGERRRGFARTRGLDLSETGTIKLQIPRSELSF